MSFLRNGISKSIYNGKSINSLIGFGKIQQHQQIRTTYTGGSSRPGKLSVWGKIQRIRSIIGNKEIELGRVFIDEKDKITFQKSPKTGVEENSRRLLEHFNSPYEMQLTLSEEKNIETMNAYYELVEDGYPKKIGTLIFTGFSNPNGIDVKDIVSSYLGLDLFSDIKRIDKFIIIHCKRNNDNLTFFEQYNADGSRNFKKIYDINKVKSNIKKFNDSPSPFHTIDFYFESPTIDNVTIIIPPTFEFLDRLNRNYRIRRRLLKFVSDSEEQIFLAPIICGRKPYKESLNEIKLCQLFDPFSVSTIGIITDVNDPNTTRQLITPEKWLEFTDKNNLAKSAIELRNRVYKMFFRNNESYLKKLITNKFKESKSIIDSFNSLGSYSKDSESFLIKFVSDWDLNSMALKLYLIKKVENLIFEKIKESMSKIKFYKSEEIFSQPKEPNAIQLLNSLEKILIFKNKNEEKINFEEFLNLKDQWLFLSERLRGCELPNHYKDNYIDEFKKSLSDIKEVEGLSFENVPNYFKISWNRSYKLVLSSLLNDDFSHQLPNKLINDSIDCLTLISNESIGSNQEYSLFTMKYLAPNFKNSIDCDTFKVLISKEFSPSVTYEQFRESVIEVIQLDSFVNTKEILGFSYLWNYIYFKAFSKKLAQDFVKLSMGSILNPLFSSSYEFILNRETATDLEERIFKLSKNSDIIKQNLGFVPLKKKEE